MPPNRILITRTDRLGDVVLSTPVIRHVRKLYPSAYIAFMVRPENKDVVAGNPDLNELIIYDKCGRHKSLMNTLRFARGLRNKKFDTGIALHPTNRVHIIMFLAGIPDRIGYNRKMGFLLTKRVFHHKQAGKKHEADYNFDLLREAGLDTSGAGRRPYMFTTENDKKFVDRIKHDYGIGDNVIALHAGASCPSKRWPPERFSRVADILAGRYDSDVVLVGGEETSVFSEHVVSSAKGKITDLTGMLLVGELAEFLSRCRLFISNDSGPVHVAVAVGTPVIAVFGRKDPGLSPLRWGPLGDKDIAIHKDVGCEKCPAHDCDKDFACLKAIAVEEVVEAAVRILG